MLLVTPFSKDAASVSFIDKKKKKKQWHLPVHF